MLRWPRRVSFVNARVLTPNGLASSVRFSSRVLAVNEPARAGDVIIDLEGAFVLPGLINAHDHLELNHYGRLKGRDRYANAIDWIDDLRPALQNDLAIRTASRHPLRDRVFIGALKNLLSGVTTVAHHNPLYRELGEVRPLRVVRRFGWAHSFAMEQRPVGANGEPGGDVRDRFSRTRTRAPFIVHAGEGIDDRAHADLARLERDGCIRDNTIVVHGVAMTETQWARMVAAGSSLVWCPASNAYLFGRSAPIRSLLDAHPLAPARICLGSDSRVTGSRDLLDELRTAAATAPVTDAELLRMVTTAPAEALRLPDAGTIAPGRPADLVVVPGEADDRPAGALLRTRRRDLDLVVIDGRPALGTPRFADLFVARGVRQAPLMVDGIRKIVNASVGRTIRKCSIAEEGVQCA